MTCHFENYVAAVLNGMWLCLAGSMTWATRSSAFSSDNHVVRFGVLSPGLPYISKLTAHRSFGGRAKPYSWGCIRQTILKMLRHLVFKMTAYVCVRDSCGDLLDRAKGMISSLKSLAALLRGACFWSLVQRSCSQVTSPSPRWNE
jgi:hypothetical protein